MSETSENYTQPTLWNTPTSTSSQGSASLPSDYTAPDTRYHFAPSLGVFLAPMFLMPANEKASQALKAAYGKKCTVSFKKRLLATWDSITSSWKTLQRSLDGGYQSYSATLPKQGMMQSGQLYELQTSALHTSGNASLLWPTPAASNPNEGETLESWLARRERVKAQKKNGNGFGTPLTIAVKLWPTPAAQDGKNSTLPPSQEHRDTLPGARLHQAKQGLWSPPQADENGSIQPPEARKGHNLSLSNQVQGTLNPDWVETLMGLPQNWTRVEEVEEWTEIS